MRAKDAACRISSCRRGSASVGVFIVARWWWWHVLPRPPCVRSASESLAPPDQLISTMSLYSSGARTADQQRNLSKPGEEEWVHTIMRCSSDWKTTDAKCEAERKESLEFKFISGHYFCTSFAIGKLLFSKWTCAMHA